MISVIIPCFNQGRFLTDCLESLAIQTAPPHEVVVVNDGSTDDPTNELCARLPHYDYPFPLRVLTQENRGLPAARNAGIRQCSGDILLPLDSDDLLLPSAVAEYEAFLDAHPDVDICYPDVLFHGTLRWHYQAPLYNRWRHTQHNWFVATNAIRRRVFDRGYAYCEEMHRGYEDWEFWLRTCVLGPFRAAPLKKCVFAYRKWGYSMLSATNHDEQLAGIRRRHTALGIWSGSTEARLRTRHAPSHCWIRAGGAPAPAPEDMVCHPTAELAAALEGNSVSRFFWFGDLSARDPSALRFLVGVLPGSRYRPLYAFFEEGADAPYLTVLDRLALLDGQQANLSGPSPSAPALLIHTRGARYPWPVSVREQPDWPLPAQEALTPLLRLPSGNLLPAGCGVDLRLSADVYYYFRRDFITPAYPHPDRGQSVLVLVLPDLAPGPREHALDALLESGTLRQRFTGIYLFTLDAGAHAAHGLFEPLVDGIYHLAALDLEPERRLEVVQQFLAQTQASDLSLIDSPAGCGLIPRVRTAGLPVRITALFPAHPSPGRLPAREDALYQLASEYASLVDRVASADEEMTSYLVDLLYFPPGKVRTISTEAALPGPAGWGERLVEWLYPEGHRPRDYQAELFGLTGQAPVPDPHAATARVA
jgi:hypothetical protein